MNSRSALATTIDTPDGPFTAVVSDHSVLASGWTADPDALVALVHPSLRPTAITTGAAGSTDGMQAVAASAAEAVRGYYAGDLAAPARVPVVQQSGEFRTHAWDVLREVPAGSVLTYTEYAEAAGRPAAVRAAAGACALNAAALFVPCHRIVRTDGSLGGFRYGLDIKLSLLTREGA
ncbi:methylated-DNA--[protein]-cysteine S-methyltransferase [Brevibacterium yomogidense]|uniref:methylated-DNA--[protein]-cysteine S-methyltransferase n=1 Tax=Brevibacterium yomogidense TaxID=946573 RepID=UPI0018DFA51C|nr:methylated-DNA--[protein]-cysteine S-methyltransferase [Brevibacterium yomogidense]